MSYNETALKIEKPFARQVAQEKNRYMRDILQGVNATIAYATHKDRITRMYAAFIRRAVKVFTLREVTSLKSGREALEYKFNTDILTNSIFLNFMQKFGFAAVTTVTETGRQDITRFVNSLNDNEIEQLADNELQKRIAGITGLNAFRAATIARTETHNAAMYAGQEAARRVEIEAEVVLEKAWIPAMDERTRPAHAAQDRDRYIGLDEYFQVGSDRMLRPGDQSASVGNLANCRCVLGHREREFA